MCEVNTSKNEASHSLMTHFLPKDVHAFMQYEGRMGLAVLVHNHGRHDTLFILQELFGVKFPQRILDEAISRDNQTTTKREWTNTFAPEITRNEN